MKYFTHITLVALALLLGCQDAPETSSSSQEGFDRSVGEVIPYATAIRWKGRVGSNGRAHTYQISQEHFSQQLQVASVGVAFQYGIDEGGTLHVLSIPIDESLKLWSDGKLILDANTDEPISFTNAKLWAQNFREQNPAAVQFHAFGSEILVNEVAPHPAFSLVPAVNDENQPQLLIWIETTATANGRIQDEPLVVDKSYPCPPCQIDDSMN